ncbi:DODA [Symbiodinium sp. KB8]|nr:DODA [Symbiodinium sp. KB8]
MTCCDLAVLCLTLWGKGDAADISTTARSQPQPARCRRLRAQVGILHHGLLMSTALEVEAFLAGYTRLPHHELQASPIENEGRGVYAKWHIVAEARAWHFSFLRCVHTGTSMAETADGSSATAAAVMQDEVVDKAAVHDDPARSSSKADEPVALEEKERAADSGGEVCGGHGPHGHPPDVQGDEDQEARKRVRELQEQQGLQQRMRQRICQGLASEDVTAPPCPPLLAMQAQEYAGHAAFDGLPVAVPGPFRETPRMDPRDAQVWADFRSAFKKYMLQLSEEALQQSLPQVDLRRMRFSANALGGLVSGQVCMNYLNHACRRGLRCIDRHPPRSQWARCRSELKRKQCPMGDQCLLPSCLYFHLREGQDSAAHQEAVRTAQLLSSSPGSGAFSASRSLRVDSPVEAGLDDSSLGLSGGHSVTLAMAFARRAQSARPAGPPREQRVKFEPAARSGSVNSAKRAELAAPVRSRSANSLHARDVSFGPIPSSSRSVSRTAQAAEKDPKHSGRPALPDPGLQFVCPRAQSEFWDSRRGIAEEPRVPVNDTIQHQGILSNRSSVLLTAHGASWIVATVEARSQQFGTIPAVQVEPVPETSSFSRAKRFEDHHTQEPFKEMAKLVCGSQELLRSWELKEQEYPGMEKIFDGCAGFSDQAADVDGPKAAGTRHFHGAPHVQDTPGLEKLICGSDKMSELKDLHEQSRPDLSNMFQGFAGHSAQDEDAKGSGARSKRNFFGAPHVMDTPLSGILCGSEQLSEHYDRHHQKLGSHLQNMFAGHAGKSLQDEDLGDGDKRQGKREFAGAPHVVDSQDVFDLVCGSPTLKEAHAKKANPQLANIFDGCAGLCLQDEDVEGPRHRGKKKGPHGAAAYRGTVQAECFKKAFQPAEIVISPVDSDPLPTLFVSHGLGPMPLLRDPSAPFPRSLAELPQRLRLDEHSVRCILVISAHWESRDGLEVTLRRTHAQGLLYDYAGASKEMYEVHHRYHPPGDPQVSGWVLDLLQEANQEIRVNSARALDHGVFVPLLLMPSLASVPVVQLSLPGFHGRRGSELARQCLEVGRALSPLRSRGVLILGSGLSTNSATKPERLERWTEELTRLCGASPEERFEGLRTWTSTLPHAREVHGREEHLLPLHVAAGAARDDSGEALCHCVEHGLVMSHFVFGW